MKDKNKVLVYSIVFLAIGLIVGGVLFNLDKNQDSLESQVFDFEKQINDYQSRIGIEEDKKYCSQNIIQEMEKGINYCLGFGPCPSYGGEYSDSEIDECRECLWRVYNYGSVGKAKCDGVEDLSGYGTFGGFGWGIEGKINN